MSSTFFTPHVHRQLLFHCSVYYSPKYNQSDDVMISNKLGKVAEKLVGLARRTCWIFKYCSTEWRIITK